MTIAPTLPNMTTDAAAFASKAYDVVVVSGGTAGLALASRYTQSVSITIGSCSYLLVSLSENPDLTVGVLEAGPDYSDNSIIAMCGTSGISSDCMPAI